MAANWIHKVYKVERHPVTFEEWLRRENSVVMTTEVNDGITEIDLFTPSRRGPGVLEIAGRIVPSDSEVSDELAATFEPCYQRPVGDEEIAKLVRFQHHAQQYS